jgi:type III pantothenate kinase
MQKSYTIELNGIRYKLGAADIGNSRIKLLIGSSYQAFSYSQAWEIMTEEFLTLLADGPVMLGYSSVNSEYLNLFKEIASRFKDLILKDVKEFLPMQIHLQYEHIEGIGEDRLLGLFGAMHHISPPLITVDCGTAVTVNAVDGNGKCLGGAIFAGINTQLDGLAAAAEGLNKIDLQTETQDLGINTVQALSTGIIKSIAGGIIEIVNGIFKSEFHGRKVPVFLTGGHAVLIAKALKNAGFPFQVNPTLVLDGIIYLTNDVNTEQ